MLNGLGRKWRYLMYRIFGKDIGANPYEHEFEDEYPIGCRAIVGDDEEDVCGSDLRGRGCVNGHEVRYCEDHIPGGAAPGLVRVDPIQFYVPEDEAVVEAR